MSMPANNASSSSAATPDAPTTRNWEDAGGQIAAPEELSWNSTHSFWEPPSGASIDYSEGAQIEEALISRLRDCDDVSAFNPDLVAGQGGWELRYHLSPERGNVLAGFEFRDGANVLEIGSGCGAITRVIGEKTTGEVIAMEGARGRARICAERVRDLTNTRVVAAPLGEVTFGPVFDVVVVIGVLEYAAKFLTDVEDPHREFLRRCVSQLKPNGTLILAIENQLGAKYLAGAKEDHTGRPFDGPEGYPGIVGGPQTFGLERLRNLLAAELESVEVHLAFPDYKFPKLVVSEPFAQKADLSELVSGTVATPGERRVAREELLVQVLAENGLTSATANSFIAAGSRNPADPGARLAHAGVLFGGYHSNRPSRVTEFHASEDFSEITAKKRLVGSASLPESRLVSWRAFDSPWLDGPTMARVVLDEVRAGRSIQQVAATARPWADQLRSHTQGGNEVPGEFLDATFANLVLAESPEFIDLEWVAKQPVSLAIPLFRSIETLTTAARREGLDHHLVRAAVGPLRETFAEVLGIEVDPSDHELYGDYVAALNFVAFGQAEDRTARRMALKVRSQQLWPMWANTERHRDAVSRNATRVKRKVRSELSRLNAK